MVFPDDKRICCFELSSATVVVYRYTRRSREDQHVIRMRVILQYKSTSVKYTKKINLLNVSETITRARIIYKWSKEEKLTTLVFFSNTIKIHFFFVEMSVKKI